MTHGKFIGKLIKLVGLKVCDVWFKPHPRELHLHVKPHKNGAQSARGRATPRPIPPLSRSTGRCSAPGAPGTRSVRGGSPAADSSP